MLEILRRLARSRRITLAIISGRSLNDVSGRVPAEMTISGNHGLEIRGCGLDFEHPEAQTFQSDIAAACASLRDRLGDWPGVWIENKRLSATVHYRQLEQRRHDSLPYAIRQNLRSFGTRLAYRAGNKAFEIRPHLAWGKGAALSLIRDRSGPFDLCICLGDDRTDETMFRANLDGLNIKIRQVQATCATHYLTDPYEVAIFLSHVLDLSEWTLDSSLTLAMGTT